MKANNSDLLSFLVFFLYLFNVIFAAIFFAVIWCFLVGCRLLRYHPLREEMHTVL